MDTFNIRKEFPFFEYNQGMVFFDNASTALKPKRVIDAVTNYYEKYSVNAHRGDYTLSYEVDLLIKDSEKKVANFINAKREEIIFTYGTTHALNLVAYGYVSKNIEAGDEILISELEHSSNILPWFRVAETTNAKIKYVELENKTITLDSLKRSITPKTKFIALAHTSNVLGDTIPVKEICEYASKKGIITIIDGAQAVPHFKVDVKDLGCDFYAFSGHKLGSPTGVGVLYARERFITKIEPLILGGGMNRKVYKEGNFSVYETTQKFEAGTPNIEAIIGLGAIIDFINCIGIDNITEYVLNLRDYALKRMQELDNVEIYNEHIKGSTIAFNIKGVFAQDAASLFNKYNICLRAGQHCAKLIDGVINTYATLRCSFYYYNTYEEIDRFIEVCKKGSDFLDAYF